MARQQGISDEPIERIVVDGNERVLIRIRCFAGDLVKEQALQFSNADVLFVSDISDALAYKQGISEEFKNFFALWIVGQDLCLQLRPSHDIFEIVTKWNKWNEKYTHNPRCEDPSDPSNDFFFVYKREALLNIKAERRTNDEAVLRLLYGEARQNILAGVYPCKVEDAVVLAGMQTQILHGDYDRDRHQAGYLIAGMRECVPSYVLKQLPLPDLERKIFGEWVKHRGQDQALCRLLYLQYCRQFPVYGSTLFPACKTLPPDGFFEHRKERLLVGVNAVGIQVVDMDKKKVIYHQEFNAAKWSATADSIKLMPRPGTTQNKAKIQEMLLITPQAHLMNNIANKAYLLLQEDVKNLDKIRNDQAKQREMEIRVENI